jgi:hypothetical protein
MHARARSFFILLALAAACGGKSLGGARPDGAAVNQGDDAAAGAAGTGTAGTSATAGTSGAAGTTGAAGTGFACGPCPLADCKPGYVKVLESSVSCCEICRKLDCDLVSCEAPPNCPTGTHLETLEGMCCPSCQPGPISEACKKGQEQYHSLRSQFIEKYKSIGCKADSDCRFVFDQNSCISTCGFGIHASQAESVVTNLKSLSDGLCQDCPPPLIPPCPQQVAFCSNGFCVSGGIKPP